MAHTLDALPASPALNEQCPLIPGDGDFVATNGIQSRHQENFLGRLVLFTVFF
jgi:hypothetical protein